MATLKSKTRPFNQSEFDEFVLEFKKESDRAAVILGAAKLDLLLYQVLQQHFAPCTTSRDELLDGDGPLGTFSSKILIASRLGLIDNEFTRALQLVRKIRNAFAHEISGCTLDSGAHRDRVRELVAPFIHKKAFALIRETHFDGRNDPSTNFRTILAFLVARLDVLFNHTEVIDTSKAIRILNKQSLALGDIEPDENVSPKSIKKLPKQKS